MPTDPEETRWYEQELAAKFAAKNAHPDPADVVAYNVWLKTPVPKDRRLVAVFLHAAFGGRCDICETPIDIDLRRPHPGAAEVDHIIPQVDLGPDIWGNVRVVHQYCNQVRSDAPYGEPDPQRMAAAFAQAVEWYNDPDARAHLKIVQIIAKTEKRAQIEYAWREEQGLPHRRSALDDYVVGDDDPEWFKKLIAWRYEKQQP
ncbi:hypothetical protein ASF30_11245 [Leifsonia sp. Leaf264]|nr:hypothetical protein ASF30_11245 [Leifsonia sp. Leaf264]